MDEFNKQLEINLLNNIKEFNNNNSLNKIRNLYKTNFEHIKTLINKYGYKQAIEDISNINLDLKQGILENLLLLKEINKGIIKGIIKINDIKD